MDILTIILLIIWGYPFVVGLVSGSLGWKFSNKLIQVSFLILVIVTLGWDIVNISKGIPFNLRRTIEDSSSIFIESLICYCIGFGITHLIYKKKKIKQTVKTY